jgi:cellulose biosynthesis protein BcsQ
MIGDKNMHKTIALFNHKGGVSKTTTTFNVGWMLAEIGHRVVMVDADPQCNLTGLVLDYAQSEDLDEFYAEHPKQNIRAGLAPAFESQPREIEAVDCIKVRLREGLFLLPGHVNLSEYEVTLGIAQELSGSIQALRNLPGAFHYFISKVAEANHADFVLIDMNPSLGAINQNLLLTSDCFIVPTAPDYFSLMAIDSLTVILPKWIEWAKKASGLDALKKAAYPFPAPNLKFLGTIIQKFRPRKGRATEGFQSWIDDINKRVAEKLVPTLSKYDLTFSNEVYGNAGGAPAQSYCLAQIPDFNTLIATSQTHQTPVFALTDEMFGHTGTVLDQDRIKRDEFRDIFTLLTNRILTLTKNV